MTTEKPLPPTATTVPTPPPAPKAGKKVGGKNVVNLDANAPAVDAKAEEAAKAAKEAAALAKKEAAAKAKEEKAAAKAKKDEERAAAKAAKEAAKAPRIEQNGVKQAQEGTSSRAIWDLTQELSLAKGSLVPMSDVKAACESQEGRWFVNKAGVNTKINPANVAIEYQMYRKFHGFPPVVVEKKVDPAVEAAKAAKAKEREEAKAKKAAEKEAAKAKKAAEKAEKVAKPEAPTAKVKAIPAAPTPPGPPKPPAV